MMMKMVRRSPSGGIVSSFLPKLGGFMTNFRANAQHGSISTKTTEDEILCLSVWLGDSKVRWYAITPPPISPRQKQSWRGSGIALIRFFGTKIQVKPSFLCETFYEHLPVYYSCVALNSKIHIIGQKARDYDQGYKMPLSSDVFNIDTSHQQITAGYGQPMIIGKSSPIAVVLDGKVYVFARAVVEQHRPLSCEVFDPNTNKWNTLPSPSDEHLQGSDFYPVVYEKKKKIFLFFGEDPCAFDVTTNSWEYGLNMPSKVVNLVWRWDRTVTTVGDFLYMFELEEFYAYDLQKKELLQVHGLEGETEFMLKEDKMDAEELKTHLIQLGKKNLCLVTARGPAAGGLHVVCLKFCVQKRDGGLHAVILGRDSYFIQEAVSLEDCVAVKRSGLGTSAISCSFDPEIQYWGIGRTSQKDFRLA